MTFKVEIRKDCKVCGTPITGYRMRTYCSETCRNKRNSRKMIQSGYSREYQRRIKDMEASKPSSKKVKCLVCGKYYVQVGSHVIARHGFESARAYREHFKLEVKKGTVPGWYRLKKGVQALENGTFKNLGEGERFRFKKGQEGVGVYERSPITIDRLKGLSKLRK